nr:aspartate/glutamate racemase family protein [Clostridia bacterium]
QVLIAQNIKALVVACNTATSAAAAFLRQTLDLPVIGMEPALKPATQLRHGGAILVLATARTLSLPKFQKLMQLYGQGAVPVPCPGLVEFVERGVLRGEALCSFLRDLLKPFLNRQVDAVVLGCTHYVFVRDAIAGLFPPSTLVIDGNEGTVRQLRRVLMERDLLRAEGEGSIAFQTSGDPKVFLPLMESLLSWDAEESVLPLPL